MSVSSDDTQPCTPVPRPWHKESIVVIDFETSGTDPAECMPVQIGVARFEAGELVAKRSALINPGIPIPEEASAIHGITDEMVKDAPPPDRAIVECTDGLIQGAVPCGYNGQAFDRVIWERFAPSLGDWIDPLVMVRHVDRFVSGKGRHRLENTCKRWGVELGQAHDALHDCLATGWLLFSDRMRALLKDMPHEEVIWRQEKERKKQEEQFQAWLAKQPPMEGGAA